MANSAHTPGNPAELFAEVIQQQARMAATLFGQMLPEGAAPAAPAALGDAAQWAETASRLQARWLEFQAQQAARVAGPAPQYSDPGKWLATLETVTRQIPLADPRVQQKLWADGLALWQGVLGQFGIGDGARRDGSGPDLPRSDPRFADPKWREQPLFALLHQTYLMLSEQILAMAEGVEGLEPAKKEKLVFATRTLLDAVSPSNFPLTNPVALERAVETRGESLVKGLENLIADLGRGQLTHTDPEAFAVGRNIALTPGKVVHESRLFQLIQYEPVTEKVLATPVVIFPPWINRYYILDLNPKKSFVAWAVAQGLTVFIVSWKSADATMADVSWDDYARAEVEAIDVARERLGVPSVHALGYCVAGTTLAATLSVLARRGEAERVKTATFLTAQVDFEEAGDLRHFVDDQQIEAIRRLSPDGYLDGRYMAATFNLLRGNDLIWSYVEKNYLLGEEHPSFDLLHWNSDVTNLPVTWHLDYLRDLYRDNRMVVADSLSVLDTPVDIRRIATPCYIQAGREDHIAPPESVWKLMRYLSCPKTFVLAGSGHIAGVVNPPAAGKYQFWTNDGPAETLDDFIAGASETKGSWWPHWAGWLRAQDPAEVPVRGKRRPGGRGDRVVEDAPGRYVAMR